MSALGKPCCSTTSALPSSGPSRPVKGWRERSPRAPAGWASVRRGPAATSSSLGPACSGRASWCRERSRSGRSESADAVFVLPTGLALGRDCGQAQAAVERLTAGEELPVYGGGGGHAQGPPYGSPLGRGRSARRRPTASSWKCSPDSARPPRPHRLRLAHQTRSGSRAGSNSGTELTSGSWAGAFGQCLPVGSISGKPPRSPPGPLRARRSAAGEGW